MLDSVPAPTTAVDAPAVRPRRRWWLRLTLAGLVILVALRLAWGCVAQRQFDRAARQVTLPPQPAPGDATLLYSQALSELAAMGGNSLWWPVRSWPTALTGYSLSVEPLHVKPIRDKLGAVGKHLAENDALLRLVHDARDRPGRAWPPDPCVPGCPGHELRLTLLHYPWAAAIAAHCRGDDETALEFFLDALALAERIPCQHERTARGWFFPRTETQLLYAFGAELLPSLEVAGPGSRADEAASCAQTPGGSRRPVLSAQLALLRGRLLDETPLAEQWRESLRYFELQSLTWGGVPWPVIWSAARSMPGLPARFVLFRPLWQQEAVAESTYWRALEPLGLSGQCPDDLPEAPTRPGLFDLLDPGGDALWRAPDVVWDHFETTALRRMLVVAVAAREFAAEQGRPPERLKELVPEYLPQVPPDPFVTGEPLALCSEGGPPRVNSPGKPQAWRRFQFGIWFHSCVEDGLPIVAATTQPGD